MIIINIVIVRGLSSTFSFLFLIIAGSISLPANFFAFLSFVPYTPINQGVFIEGLFRIFRNIKPPVAADGFFDGDNSA